MMTSLRKRLHRLEARSLFGSPARPRETLRVVVQSVYGRANLATSKCSRMLADNGVLTEIVELDGCDEGLGKEELDRFVASFSVQTIGGGNARW